MSAGMKYIGLVIFSVFYLTISAQLKHDTVFNEYNHKIISVTISNGPQKTVFTYSTYDPQFIISQKEYLNEKPNGRHVEYLRRDVLAKETNFKDSKKSGLETIYNDGKISIKANYLNDVLHGLKTTYYFGGNIQSAENYTNGYKTGKCKYYYKSGQLSHEGYFDTLMQFNKYSKKWEIKQVADGLSRSYYENGSKKNQIKYVKEKKNGKCIEWYESGKLKAKNFYNNDVLSGKQITYFSNGNIEKKYEVYYEYDSIKKYNKMLYNGDYQEYFENGRPKTKGFYRNYLKHGDWLEYSQDFLTSSGKYKNGYLIGEFKTYFPTSGKLYQYKFYKEVKINGKDTSIIDGQSLLYHLNGKISSKIIYDNGRVISSTSYTDNGTLVYEEYIKDSIAYRRRYYNSGIKENEYQVKYDPKLDLSAQKYNMMKSYHPNGQLKQENSLPENQTGFLQEFNDSGKVIRKSIRIHGNMIFETKYYPTGSFKMETMQYPYYSLRQYVDYYENGNPKSWGTYGVYKIVWLSDGTLMKTQSFKNYNENTPVEKDTLMNIDSLKSIYNALKKNHNRVAFSDLNDGIKTSYYMDGKPRISFEIKNGIPVNYFKAYYLNGQPMAYFQIKDGKLHGKYETHFENGVLAEKGTYCEGLQCGEWFYGTIFGDTLKHYRLTEPSPDNNYEGKSDYIKEFNGWAYSKRTTLKRIFIKGNKPEDLVSISYHPNGQLAQNISYSSVTKLQTIKSFWPNGNVGYIQHKDSAGNLWGYYCQGRENGKLYYELNYKNNIMDGFYKSYHENGKPLYEGVYVNGVKTGTWKKYDLDGNLILSENYIDGKSDVVESASACKCSLDPPKETSYMPMVNDLLNTSKANVWQFGFHTSITKVLDHLFYKNYQNSFNRANKWSSCDVVSYDEIVTKLPNDKGLELVLNPCVKIKKWSSIWVSVDVIEKQPNSLKVNIKPADIIAFRFNPKLLKPVNIKIPKTEATFKVNAMSYSQYGLLIDKPSEMCFQPSQIVNTKAKIELTTYLPQIKLGNSVEFMNLNFMDSNIEENFGEQAGICNGKGKLNIISNGVAKEFELMNVVITENKLLGEISVKTEKGDNLKVKADEIAQQIKASLNEKSKVTTLIQGKEIIVSFMVSY